MLLTKTYDSKFEFVTAVCITLLVHRLSHTTTATILLLTVILTNVGQVTGPRCLINVNTPIMWYCRITKLYGSRPDVAVMLSTI